MSKPKIALPTEACLLKDRQRIVKSSKQALFDRAVRGVLKQGKPSMNTYGSCQYRGPDGLKCAAGHLLSDETVKKVGEGKKFAEESGYPSYDKLCPSEKMGMLGDKALLVRELQIAHDSASILPGDSLFIGSFKQKVIAIAAKHGLNAGVVQDKVSQ